MRISGVPHPYRKACPSVALPSHKACRSVAHPSHKACRSVAHPCRSVAVALRSCRTQGQRLEPKDHCIQSMPPSPRGSHYAATLRAMPRCFAIAVGPSSAFSCLICAASLGARDHAGAAAGGHRQGEGRRGGHHARMVSMSLLAGLRASSRSPPMDSTTRPMPRFDRSASMASSSAPAAFRPRSCAVSPAAQVDYGVSREIVAPLTL